MTRDEWRRAQPVLTRALSLPSPHREAAIESAAIEEAIRRELLEVLRRTSGLLPGLVVSRAGAGACDAGDQQPPESIEPPLPLLRAGQAIADGRFAIIRQLGRGGMGEVYLAHDKTLGSLVALKVLYDTQLREAQHARLCSGHPHVVTLHDVFEAVLDGQARTVLVMEYVAGRAANDVIDDGPVPLRDAVRWIREVAAALAHAHDRDVLHCDLKPANILITPDQGAKVLDFGIGRATFDGARRLEPLRGTALYIPPEQLLERHFSPAGDIYSLGVTLFELVTGRPPFDGDTPEVMLQIVGAPPPRASEFRNDVPPRLDEILARMLAKQPGDRYRSARALDRALDALEWDLTTITSPVPAPAPVPIPAPPARVSRYAGYAAALLVVLTALGFVSSTVLDSGLERTGAFRSESPLSWPVWGAMSLTAPLLLTAAGALLMAIITPLVRLLWRVERGPIASLRRMSTRLSSVTSNALAQALLAVNIVALVLFLAYYLPLLEGIAAFMSEGPGSDISVLGPQHATTHNSYRQVMTILLAILGLAWYRLLRRRRELGEKEGLPTLFGAGLAIGVSLLLQTMPHRLIYLNDFEQVRYEGQQCSFVGQSGEDALLFCPLASDRSRRVSLKDPALMRTGVIEAMFTPLDSGAPVAAKP